jgi:2-polyprenyl-3-methyl-5-hydroxy-6-metoxy-1,4-benzoquinol methylase
MDQTTINQLNQLNKKFYQTTAEQFANSRQYFWQGWDKLLPKIKKLTENKDKIKVLDLGCGNGRFAQFLKENKVRFEYLGVDNNQALLDITKANLSSLKIVFELEQLDLVDSINKRQLQTSFENKFDLIVLFGVIHHVPGFDLRSKLIRQLSQLLTKNGLLVVTAWQFAAKDRFQQKTVDPQQLDLNPKQLEKNDYILDWRRGERAYRYCHYFTESEMAQILNKLDQLNPRVQFYADGKSQDLNLYFVLQNSQPSI